METPLSTFPSQHFPLHGTTLSTFPKELMLDPLSPFTYIKPDSETPNLKLKEKLKHYLNMYNLPSSGHRKCSYPTQNLKFQQYKILKRLRVYLWDRRT